jgi:GNAT superfamily N-acetyltransferase
VIDAISIASPADARAIADLRTAVARDMTSRFGPGHWSACPSKATVLRQMRASQMLVARRGADIVGTVRLAMATPPLFDSSGFTPVKTSLYVLGLAVAPDYRQHGAGRQLMDAAKKMALARPAEALWLDAYDHVAGAGPFYLRCGFREVGRSDHGDVGLVFYEWLAGGR